MPSLQGKNELLTEPVYRWHRDESYARDIVQRPSGPSSYDFRSVSLASWSLRRFLTLISAAIYAQAQAQAHVEAQLQAHAESQAAQAQQAQIQAQVEAHHAQQAARLHAMQSQAQFMPGGQWTQEFVNPAAAGGMMPIGGGPPL